MHSLLLAARGCSRVQNAAVNPGGRELEGRVTVYHDATREGDAAWRGDAVLEDEGLTNTLVHGGA